MPAYGFGNHHQSSAIKGALPLNQNTPLELNHHLVAEQLSGSAFTRPRHSNLHSWLYRKHPSVVHSDYEPSTLKLIHPLHHPLAPNPLRWLPLPKSSEQKDWLDGLTHFASNEHAHLYLFQCQKSMSRYFSSYDGELLFLPYQGELHLHTEFGNLSVKPGSIAVIPRGVFFKVHLDALTQGYVCENKGLPFVLPELGVLGANALANPRHFVYPDAAFEENVGLVTLICKTQDLCFEAQSPHSPLNVLAWHGNLAPYTYDLSLFNTINTVSFDHPDPSLFTVLTAPSAIAGIANLDFVIFPPRWLVAQHTFRPPYYHRNTMSELMGLIKGKYDAKQKGFEPGGISIHNAFVPHGPDTSTYEQALKAPQKPEYLNDTLAFMFESSQLWQPSALAMALSSRDKGYTHCWNPS